MCVGQVDIGEGYGAAGRIQRRGSGGGRQLRDRGTGGSSAAGYRRRIVGAHNGDGYSLGNRRIVAVAAVVFDSDRIGRRNCLAFREVLDQVGIQREIPVEVMIARSQGRRRNRQCGGQRESQCRRDTCASRCIVVVGNVRRMGIRQVGISERDRAVVFQNTTDRIDVFLDCCAVVDDRNNGLVIRGADLNRDLLCRRKAVVVRDRDVVDQRQGLPLRQKVEQMVRQLEFPADRALVVGIGIVLRYRGRHRAIEGIAGCLRNVVVTAARPDH